MSYKIDSATFYYESEQQTLSSIAAGSFINLRLDSFITGYAQICNDYIIVSVLPIVTGGGSGNSMIKVQGVGGSLAQTDYGITFWNTDTQAAHGPWYYKVILGLLKKQQ